ncbi:hypothetical protein N431DRAFT_453897 [Stipitochalara longipes BDJ]|nr:hypothetical protein N431DRAFT_453897 [Stipitochalara longipes BDJ]
MAGPPHKLIVHFMRHAEEFAKKFDGQELYITHIISSPMTRAITTASLAFKRVMELPQNSDLSIIAVPELQNFDKGPNGRGQSARKLAKKYCRWFKRKNKDTPPEHLRIDAKSLVPRGWNSKESGKWSTGKWRLYHVKGHLQGLWVGAGAGTRKVEVVVVSHSSFFRRLLEDGEFYPEPDTLELMNRR